MESDDDDFWHDLVEEAEALRKIGIFTEPTNLSSTEWHCGNQPTISKMGMSGVNYLEGLASSKMGQAFTH